MPYATSEGPQYPNLGLARFRSRARTPENDRAYGEAVGAAIRALQRRELARETSIPRPACASGTWESDGAAIGAAIRRQHRAQLSAAANADRRRRTDAEIIAEATFLQGYAEGWATEARFNMARGYMDAAVNAQKNSAEFFAEIAKLRQAFDF